MRGEGGDIDQTVSITTMVDIQCYLHRRQQARVKEVSLCEYKLLALCIALVTFANRIQLRQYRPGITSRNQKT